MWGLRAHVAGYRVGLTLRCVLYPADFITAKSPTDLESSCKALPQPELKPYGERFTENLHLEADCRPLLLHLLVNLLVHLAHGLSLSFSNMIAIIIITIIIVAIIITIIIVAIIITILIVANIIAIIWTLV